jgi:RNA polymerase sigma-70 factor (ECF subfamily)
VNEATRHADETALIARVQSGDTTAFDDLVRCYMRPGFSVAYRVLRHREDAEDLIQEAFMVVLEKIDTFDPSRPFGPWFYRIVVNRALNARRARTLRRADPLPADAATRDESPAMGVERREMGERLARALASLPEPQRLVVILFELDGLSSVEIGGMLDMPEGTIRWHLHEARVALRKVLAPLKEGVE